MKNMDKFFYVLERAYPHTFTKATDIYQPAILNAIRKNHRETYELLTRLQQASWNAIERSFS